MSLFASAKASIPPHQVSFVSNLWRNLPEAQIQSQASSQKMYRNQLRNPTISERKPSQTMRPISVRFSRADSSPFGLATKRQISLGSAGASSPLFLSRLFCCQNRYFVQISPLLRTPQNLGCRKSTPPSSSRARKKYQFNLSDETALFELQPKKDKGIVIHIRSKNPPSLRRQRDYR